MICLYFQNVKNELGRVQSGIDALNSKSKKIRPEIEALQNEVFDLVNKQSELQPKLRSCQNNLQNYLTYKEHLNNWMDNADKDLNEEKASKLQLESHGQSRILEESNQCLTLALTSLPIADEDDLKNGQNELHIRWKNLVDTLNDSVKEEHKEVDKNSLSDIISVKLVQISKALEKIPIVKCENDALKEQQRQQLMRNELETLIKQLKSLSNEAKQNAEELETIGKLINIANSNLLTFDENLISLEDATNVFKNINNELHGVKEQLNLSNVDDLEDLGKGDDEATRKQTLVQTKVNFKQICINIELS